MTAPDPVLMGFLGSLAAGSLTAAGAVPVLVGRGVSPRVSDIMLGFAAGVMLAASFLSLILPGVGIAAEAGGRLWAPTVAALGTLAGVAFVVVLDRVLPHEHFVKGREGPAAEQMRRVWLFVLAITIHNAPEGMAVGVGFGAGDIGKGITLAIGIGLQNAPEGLAVALALAALGYPRLRAFAVASLTGAVEPLAGFAGALAVSLSEAILPWGMMFAAGAMLGVIALEIVPETQRRGHAPAATLGLGAGLAIMMFLDLAFA